MQPTPQLVKEYACFNKRGLIGLDFTLRIPLRPAYPPYGTKLAYQFAVQCFILDGRGMVAVAVGRRRRNKTMTQNQEYVAPLKRTEVTS